MKDDLILEKFITESVVGTLALQEISSFFGGKMMKVEDEIEIDATSIQYYEVSGDTSVEGYQYFDFDTMGINYETIVLESLFNVKLDNHTISLLQQTNQNLLYNTNWQIDINIKSILQTYLFLKIKQSRAFKCIQSSNLINKNINQSIYDYITFNVIDRFGLDHIDFFIQYYDILETNTLYNQVGLQYNPVFNSKIESSTNLIPNVSMINNNYLNSLNDVIINYNQTKPSNRNRFDYYFNVYYKRI